MSESTPVEVKAVRDLYLEMLLSVLDGDESNRSEVSVTFMVGGSVITGNLINHDRWEEETRASLERAGEGAASLVRLLNALREGLSSSEEEESAPFNFVHLKDAQIVTNHLGSMNGIVPMTIKRGLWRGRLADVQGWSLGREA
ncbi:hypothetical protein PV677_36115 [Streptomyces sp. DE06-01C]|uniref:hypothetical protein n=1 Tax=Streptomyces sp. DE06-01C TaxID=3028656 RepID=UPI0029C4631F|nr:hypothetical protein [Streptomyces sp. DE06-01C]MDX5526097.1 hypothetical protein [Streptomyces sp. DE06-01C]